MVQKKGRILGKPQTLGMLTTQPLLAKPGRELQGMVDRVATASSYHGVYFYFQKSNVMEVESTEMHLNDMKLEQVDSYRYLGANATSYGSWEKKFAQD